MSCATLLSNSILDGAEKLFALAVISLSAVLGQSPISSNDELVYKGLLETSPGTLKALPSLPDVSNQSRAPSMITGGSSAFI